MIVSIATLFPDLYKPFLETSIVGRAQKSGAVTFDLVSLLSFVGPKVRIDAPTFGHGAGMLIKPEIVEHAVTHQEAQRGKAFKIFFSPHGKKLTPALAQECAQKSHILLLPARYEGMDARVEEEYADLVISIGDYVLMGGDLPAMVFLEAMLRHVPGVIGKQESVEQDSFSGPFVDYPEYCEPVTWHGKTVPDIVRSGNHAALKEWRREQAAQRTVLHHFEWLKNHVSTEADKKLAKKYIPDHYAVLMHDQVLVPQEQSPELLGKISLKEGVTSVTSLDIHDIARSAHTYGIKNYFLVTPLADQQIIVRNLLDFWKTGSGVTYNKSRHDAVKQVELYSSLDDVIDCITKKTGKAPLLIASSAKETAHEKLISYADQEKVFAHNRPVLFVFGTGRGLSPALINRCDFLFIPLEGFSHYNHLSVRSAAAIIFDRWLGVKNIAA